jgi:hypothetical protein
MISMPYWVNIQSILTYPKGGESNFVKNKGDGKATTTEDEGGLDQQDGQYLSSGTHFF